MSQRNRRLCLLAIFILSALGCSTKHPSEPQSNDTQQALSVAGFIEFQQARSPATPPGAKHGVAYVIAQNATGSDAVITGLRSDVAGTVEVHRHLYEEGVMKMRPVAHARIPAKGALVFEPGGYHIMLMDLFHPLEAGSEYSIIIDFADGRTSTLTIPVVAN